MSEAKAIAPPAQSPKDTKESARDADWLPIHKALPLIIGAIGPIAKNSENKQQGYKFRGIDDVYKVLNILLARYGVSIRPEVLETALDSFQSKSGGTLFRSTMKVRYHLTAGADGSTLTCDVPGEGMDSGDKSTPKALSCAYKYMAFQLFCIPTGEKIDSEEDSHEVASPNGKHEVPEGSDALAEELKQALIAARDTAAVEKVAAGIVLARQGNKITPEQAAALRPVYIAKLKETKPPEQAKA